MFLFRHRQILFATCWHLVVKMFVSIDSVQYHNLDIGHSWYWLYLLQVRYSNFKYFIYIFYYIDILFPANNYSNSYSHQVRYEAISFDQNIFLFLLPFIFIQISLSAILFFLYATHVIYHAGIKYPSEEDDEKKEIMTTRSDQSYIHPPSLKRRRDEGFLPNGTTGPLFEVKKIGNADGKYKTAKFGNNRRNDDIRRRRHVIRYDGDVKRKLSTDNNESNEEVYIDYR